MKNYRYDPDKLKFVEDEGIDLRIKVAITVAMFLLLSLVMFVAYLASDVTDSDQPPTKRSAVMIVSRPLLYAVTGTYYNAEAGQCDDRPTETADGSKISLSKLRSGAVRWVALSRDLLKRWGGHFNYGDTIHVWHHDKMLSGRWVVRDCMNRRFKRRIDFLVDSRKVFPGLSHGVLISKNKIKVL
jgi:hypothetical protein